MFERVGAKKTEKGVAVFMRAYGKLVDFFSPKEKKGTARNRTSVSHSLSADTCHYTTVPFSHNPCFQLHH